MGKKKGNKEEENRIDMKHRFPLRIDEVLHHEFEVLAFQHNVSLNLIYCEALLYARDSQGFLATIAEKYKRDERKGHFVFLKNENTKQRGKVL